MGIITHQEMDAKMHRFVVDANASCLLEALAAVLTFNRRCVHHEFFEMNHEERVRVADSITLLLDVHDGVTTDLVRVTPKVLMEPFTSAIDTVHRILKEFGLPVVNSHRDESPQDRFTICRGDNSGWGVICEDHDEENTTYGEAEYDPNSVPGYPPFHLVNREDVDIVVFEPVAMFSPISPELVADLNRSLSTILAWMATDTSSEGPLPKGFNEAESNIISVITLANQRMTTKQVVKALSDKYGAASEGSTKGYLASLVRNSKLTNCKDAWGDGYGLPVWTNMNPVRTASDKSVPPTA